MRGVAGRYFRIGVAVLLSASGVSCSPAAVKEDPVRAEFIAACEGRIEYRSMTPKRRQAVCACSYDTSLDGLSEAEQQAARFYLLSQVGVDVSQCGFVDRSNLDAIGAASAAIGRAVQHCG